MTLRPVFIRQFLFVKRYEFIQPTVNLGWKMYVLQRLSFFQAIDEAIKKAPSSMYLPEGAWITYCNYDHFMNSYLPCSTIWLKLSLYRALERGLQSIILFIGLPERVDILFLWFAAMSLLRFCWKFEFPVLLISRAIIVLKKI